MDEETDNDSGMFGVGDSNTECFTRWWQSLVAATFPSSMKSTSFKRASCWINDCRRLRTAWKYKIAVFFSAKVCLCRRNCVADKNFPSRHHCVVCTGLGRKFTCVSHICQSCTSLFVLILLKFVVVMICVNETFVHRGWGKNNTRRVSAGHFAFCGASLQPLHWLG